MDFRYFRPRLTDDSIWPATGFRKGREETLARVRIAYEVSSREPRVPQEPSSF